MIIVSVEILVPPKIHVETLDSVSSISAMPGSIVSGNVRIHDLVYLGTNSSIKEKLTIHSLSTIGLNTGVIKDITEPGVYGGVPANKKK